MILSEFPVTIYTFLHFERFTTSYQYLAGIIQYWCTIFIVLGTTFSLWIIFKIIFSQREEDKIYQYYLKLKKDEF